VGLVAPASNGPSPRLAFQMPTRDGTIGQVAMMLADSHGTVLASDGVYEVRINCFASAENNHLFNEPAFFRLHSESSRDVYAQLVRIADKKVFATIAFYDVGDGVFSSPRRGTFGGLGLNHPLEMRRIEAFFLQIVKYLRAAGAAILQVKLAPLSHNGAVESTIVNILLRNQWTLSGHELNCDLRVDSQPFIDRIDYGNAKRIRKCQRERIAATQLALSDLPEVYRVIAENRTRRSYPMSMTLPQLQDMARTFPSAVHLFGVHGSNNDSALFAAAVCIALSPTVLYVFLWGDADGMATYSPIAPLASAIYEYCQREGFAILDAGTSTVDGAPNYGLLHFKHGLGFSESLKLSFSRTL